MNIMQLILTGFIFPAYKPQAITIIFTLNNFQLSTGILRMVHVGVGPDYKVLPFSLTTLLPCHCLILKCPISLFFGIKLTVLSELFIYRISFIEDNFTYNVRTNNRMSVSSYLISCSILFFQTMLLNLTIVFRIKKYV